MLLIVQLLQAKGFVFGAGAATATWSNSIMVETYDFCHVFITAHTPSRSPTAHR